MVAPFVGAWIEILWRNCRGRVAMVAPFVGAWIEMTSTEERTHKNNVAPFVGAWIEIGFWAGTGEWEMSLRSSERGLKFRMTRLQKGSGLVAPFVGAWIEIILST